MINAIIKGIFSLITMIASLVLSPFIAIITALFPDLTNVITNVLLYFTTMLQFVPLCMDFLMIPRQAIVFLFDYYVIKYTIYLTIRAIKCALAIYNKLKV